MLFNFLVLFLSALFAGLAVFLIGEPDMRRFKKVLAFSGSYLFSITVIHLLPEIYHESSDIRLTGIYVLCGFIFQMVLEYFTSGVEHGHIHHHHAHSEGQKHIPYSIFLSMLLHSLLEGTMLIHPSHAHEANESDTLLYGLILHKIPETFALMSVLVLSLGKKKIAVLLLIVFALASPLGLVAGNLLYAKEIVGETVVQFLVGLVAGNFLYISTTIFFETSPDHKFKANKLLVSLLGAGLAILAEYIL